MCRMRKQAKDLGRRDEMVLMSKDKTAETQKGRHERGVCTKQAQQAKKVLNLDLD